VTEGERLDREVRDRWRLVRERIGAAARRAGRDPDAIRVLPVTKGHPAAAIEAVRASGFKHVGENRVAEAGRKREKIPLPELCWHMIGHLQRNKVAAAVRTFDVVESVDSIRLAARLGRELDKLGRSGFEVLAQVNASGEASKSGFDADRALVEIAQVCRLPHLRVTGLMTMAPFTSDERLLRDTMRRARVLFDRCAAEIEGFEGCVLSMGMSNDFEIAVEEGSTQLRLGSALLGERRST